jgi:hypothetical protein
MARCILVGELDGFVLRQSGTRQAQNGSGQNGLDEHAFHEKSPNGKRYALDEELVRAYPEHHQPSGLQE